MRQESIDYAYSVVRPIRFYTDDYLWGRGTCFLVTLASRYYAVTARHVVENQTSKFNDVRILMPDSSVSLPLIGHICARSELLDSDHVDILIYLVDAGLYSSLTGLKANFLSLEKNFYPARSLVGKGAAVLGYPATDDRYNYDEKILLDNLLIKTGVVSYSEIGAPAYKLESTPSDITFDGMSGSPIMTAIERTLLIGLVIRATNQSGVFHFIDFTVVYAAILQHQKQTPFDSLALST